ncbi:TlrC/CarA/OleB/SrmB family ABC-F type ribosomal protection protein [Nonomuraea typhae]|uniref:TlrC/CarA/OleB/SrmB family ABC-F type ribosomal protection protein n=1 Tax=Nonomuraea typhae TaxID=2603600 RepID=UPI0012F7AAF6|nr:TlrC/CarA/OleB/SrmB family ABC-F type ribosomal protection protein [Nonomuraea typhae]
MRTAQLSLAGITKRYDDRVVLDQVSFTVKPGEKVGVIGDNGSGKSTLLRVIAGVEPADNGELTVVAPGGTGYLPQALDLPAGATVADTIDWALRDLRDLESRIRAAEADLPGAGPAELAAYGELIAAYEARGGYDADARVEIALHGLGLPGLDRTRPLGTLSGGERSRLALAATLAARPELLLLDEPTNDLDDQAVAWLEEHLRAHRGTVVAITHDRVFLDRITSTILEVDQARVRRYGNGYTGYLTAKAAERAAWALAHEEWKNELARHANLVTANASRLGAIPRKAILANMGTGAWRARSRVHGAMSRIRQSNQRLEHLRANPVPPPPDPLRFTASVTALGEVRQAPVAELTGIHVSGRLTLDSLRIRQGERLLVTGPNGAGKSTLLQVLAGDLTPDAGTLRRPGKVGYLRQEERPIRPGQTVLRAYAEGRPGSLDDHADELLSMGLFRPEDLRLRVGQLSYGQRRRIDVARLVSSPVDLLLLDEPTNHLSPLLVEQLEEALSEYRGALVIVTHDRRMRTAFQGSHLHLHQGHPTTLQAA